jgi:hypothetical protein
MKAKLRQTTLQRHLTTFKTTLYGTTGTGFLSFMPTTTSFTLT